MAKFEIPNSPTRYIYYLSDFLGVDYSNPMELQANHATEMKNMIYKNGYLAKRNGLKIKLDLGSGNINGMWQFDISSDPTYDEVLIVHCGTKLYEVTNFGTDEQAYVDLLITLPDTKSFGILHNDYLFILTGTTAYVYGKFGNSVGIRTLTSAAFIPLTTIGINPATSAGTINMPTNLLTPYRRNNFFGDGETTVYHTDATGTISASDIKVWILDETTGVWTLQTSGYTVDTNNTITFDIAPYDCRDAGYANVYIEFKDTSVEFSNYIDKCTMACEIGAKTGELDLVFSGHANLPAAIFTTSHNFELNQEGPTQTVGYPENCFYVPGINYQFNIGDRPITGLMRLSDSVLGIFKKLSDSDSTIYYGEVKTVASRLYAASSTAANISALAITPGSKTIGCLNQFCTCNLLDHNIFLSEQGVFETVTGQASATLERYASHHSYYVDKKLLKEENLDNAMAVGCDNWYYLFLNNKAYVADVTIHSEPQHDTTQQYEFYMYTDLPTIKSCYRWNNEILIGDDNGCIYMFGTDFRDEYLDDERNVLSKPVKCYWETRPIDFGYPTKAKTTKTLTLNYMVLNRTKFDYGYKTVDDARVISDTVDTKEKEFVVGYPRTTQIKEKIRKVMFVSFFVESNNDKDCEFDRISVTYTLQDKYRGV